MIEVQDNCVGCPTEMGCLGEACKYINVTVMICDDCGDEVQELWYGDDGNQYCEDCIKNHIEKVAV